ncbi:hypothetical protein [Vibrio phage VP4B]|uniref:Uncharacterized protein n=1 Tax=Vibrio phage VP4B TaxID=1262540 RepID=V9M039_9CAUD|nr:hypothetical protein FDJ61_gp082 [Vibrio phage VP4B]AGB07196.1 hypothetical protein [Vibrio phage VP4B]
MKDYVNAKTESETKSTKVAWYRTNGAICSLMLFSLYVAVQYGNW